MKPFQRITRPGLRELENLASKIQVPTVSAIGNDPGQVWALAERHRARLPEKMRSALGIFYTPPNVADRLLDDLEAAGARYDGSQVFCDPACGGGAFLLPIARRIARRLPRSQHAAHALARCLIGIDVDAGGLAITRAALDALARESFGDVPRWNLRNDNTLRLAVEGRLPRADVVVGNPPFGRVRLNDDERTHFAGSIKGHANLYGLFVDVGLAISNGLVGLVMPTSWLAGDYFSALRKLLISKRPPMSVRFIESRTAVFMGVLQEMCLAVFGHPQRRTLTVFGDVDTDSGWTARLRATGPWFIPRRESDALLLSAAAGSDCRLADYGYGVHTGPLVWNRHRDQLRTTATRGTAPIVWADAVRPFEPVDYRRSKRTHLHLMVNGMGHLLLDRPAVLIKRTTAKEQRRRLVAAPFDRPPAMVENHLNVVTSNGGSASVSVELISALLNSEPVDRIFRSLSGSVAVSATELVALPLPPPRSLTKLASAKDPDEFILAAYLRN
jgi:adenine-specific DNA-methyltransferase